MTNQQKPEALRPIPRYKIGYHADEWGMRSSTPSGIPDHTGSWVRYEDHAAALAAVQQPAPADAEALSDDLRDRLVAISEAIADQDDRAAQSMIREILKAPQPAPSAAGADPMDWPLPCDVTVGHGTMCKGVSLRTLVMRMKVLYEMATGNNADEVANRTPEENTALADAFRARIAAAPQPSPTPQADSQPAPDPADIIAGALQTSRGHAIEIMRQAVDADRVARIQTDSQPIDSDTLYLLRRLLSNQHTLTCPEFREELAKLVESAKTQADSKSEDTELLDFIEQHPEMSFRYRKGKWAFLGFTNYEYEMLPSLRDAVRHTLKEVNHERDK